MIQELIFTSAPRGLQLGKSGFCTVASTAGMAENVARLLESLSGYRHLFPPGTPEAATNPVNFSHLISRVGGKDLHIFSRVADAGLDYSGRSNKLAHHIACDASELPAGGPAAVLRSHSFVTRWDREPERLPPRKLAGGSVAPGVCSTWERVTGDAGWGGALAEAGYKKRPAVVIVGPGAPSLELVLEALALLPENVQEQVTFSTFYTNLPANVQCLWRFVLADSPEAAAAKRNPQNLVIDCTTKLGICSSPAADEARQGRRYASKVSVAPPVSGRFAEEPLLELAEDDAYELPPSLSGDEHIRSAPPPAPYRMAGAPAGSAPPELGPPPRAPGRFGRGRHSRRDDGTDDRPSQVNTWGIVMLVVGILMTLGGMALFGLTFLRTNQNERLATNEGDAVANQSSLNADKAAADKAAAEKAAAEKAAADKAAAEKAAADKAAAEKAAAEKAAAEKAAAEKAAAEKAAAEKAAAEKAAERVTAELVFDKGDSNLEPLLLQSPTKIAVNTKYLIASIDYEFNLLVEKLKAGSAISLFREGDTAGKNFNQLPGRANDELVCRIELGGKALTYSIIPGGSSKSLLTVEFDNPPSNDLDLQGTMKISSDILADNFLFPVVPVAVIQNRLGDKPRPFIVKTDDKREGIKSVELVSEYFDEFNQETSNKRPSYFSIQINENKKTPLKIRGSSNPEAFPEFSFSIEIGSTGAAANWVCTGVSPRDLSKLSPLSVHLLPTDNKKSWVEFDKRQNEFKSVEKYLEDLREVLWAHDGAMNRIPRNDSFGAKTKIDEAREFLSKAKSLIEANMPKEVSDWAGDLVFVFRCRDQYGVFLVVLSNKNKTKFEAIELKLREKLGADVYQTAVPQPSSADGPAVGVGIEG